MASAVSQLFSASAAEVDQQAGKVSMQNAVMGQRTSMGRYKAPLLPGEDGPKSGGDWVPGGMQSTTNLASSISDMRALATWQLQQLLIGLGGGKDWAGNWRAVKVLRRDLTECLDRARAADVDFQALSEHPQFRDELDILVERALTIGGANAARDAGIRIHDVWEQRVKTRLFSEEALRSGDAAAIEVIERLLDEADLEVIPELSERTVRNVEIDAMGRFDNILLCRRTGRLLMADLKTKAKPFWGMLEIDGQLAGYAYAEWMLTPDGQGYEDGPKRLGVDLNEGVVLHLPSRADKDGKWEPRLRRADLAEGIQTMRLARQVCIQRSRGQSAARMAASWW